MTRLRTKKAALNGKTNHTPDNSMTPAARVCAIEVVTISVKKETLKPNPESVEGNMSATRAFMGDHIASLK